jgi:hypothetical protein
MRQINIDLDVHKLIEGERKSFDEPDIVILRRLLNLPPVRGGNNDEAAFEKAKSPNSKKRSWIGTNRKTGRRIELAHGTPAYADYSGQHLEAIIDDGKWRVGNKLYDNPSKAVMGHVITKDGTNPSLSGWREWKVEVGNPPRRVPLTEL